MKKLPFIIPSITVLLIISSAFYTHLRAQTIRTFAGGSVGEGKVATAIGIAEARAMATDTAGNLFVFVNNRLRKVEKLTGIITTIAGGGLIDNGDNIPVMDAALSDLTSIAIDKHNTIYISNATTIRRIDPNTNHLIRMAGSGFGFAGDNGPALDASFQSISGIATDTAGNIYVSDAFRVRKIDIITGIINTIAGNGTNTNSGDNGPATSAGFSILKAIAPDSSGNIYLLTSTYTVRKITAATGIVTTVAGTGVPSYSGDGGLATAAKLFSPNHIGTDAAGDLYISDYCRLRKVNTVTGIINTIAGTFLAETSGDGGSASTASFAVARTIAIARDGNVYVEDFSSNSVRKIDHSSNIITRWIGNGTIGVSGLGGSKDSVQLYRPHYMALDKLDHLYISDQPNGRIYKINSFTHEITTTAGTGALVSNVDNGMAATAARIGMPFGLSPDTAGNLYFVDYNMYIRKVDGYTGILSTVAGTGVNDYSGDGGPATLAAINNVKEIAVDGHSNLYIADAGNNRIRKIDVITGIITSIAGTGTPGYSASDSIAIDAALNGPSNIRFDKNDNLYFCDNGGLMIRRIDAITGHITTIAGTGVGGYTGDGGTATAAQTGFISALTTDDAGNVYLSDQNHSIVRKIDMTTGIISKLSGTYLQKSFSGDNGPAIDAELNNPAGLAVDHNNNLYIADVENNRIRIINLLSAVIPPAVLKGTAFYDINFDGVKNANEIFADNITISVTQGGSDVRTLTKNGEFAIPQDTGYYAARVVDQQHYTVLPAVHNGYNYAGYAGDSVTFALQPVANQYDLSVNIIPTSAVRIGSKMQYRLEFKNSGTMVANNARLRFIKSGKAIITATNPAYSTISGDTLTWNLNTIDPAYHGIIQVEALMGIPPVANFNDSLYTQAIITQSDVDVRPFNDTMKLRQLVTGSYDPNDKTETHGGYLSPAQVTNGEYLNYVIRFQNTGNDTAFKVVIRDTLENNFDYSSLQMIASSHNYTLTITDNNKLEWKFDNILLADSNTNEKASHGFIAFRIKPNPSVTTGTVLKNLSDIYFDFNPPVRTNNTQTLIKDMPLAPPKPSVGFNPNGYCGTIMQQKIKIDNLNSAYKAKVIVGSVAVPVGADSVFNINTQLIPPGTYNVRIQYINESGESWLVSPVTILKPVTPEITVSANKTIITSLSDIAVITVTNKKDGGLSPLYSFAKDKNFTDILQAESSSAVLSLNADRLSNGDNRIYVRMRTSETCYTTATVTDSIKITRNLTTTSVTDVDNPGVSITGYPNPFSDQITVTGLAAYKTYSLNLYDARGVLLNSYRISNKTVHMLNTSGLSKGTYWITIRDTGKNKMIGTLKTIRN